MLESEDLSEVLEPLFIPYAAQLSGTGKYDQNTLGGNQIFLESGDEKLGKAVSIPGRQPELDQVAGGAGSGSRKGP